MIIPAMSVVVDIPDEVFASVIFLTLLSIIGNP
jgi:hypothetical protein